MQISGNHRLVNDNGANVPFTLSPNTSGGYGASQPTILVMHYTAGSTTAGDISWLTNPNAPGKPSAHLVISRDGKITQLVPFNVVAHHAGAGTYKGAGNMNGRSIGIELSNAGLLRHVGNQWKNDNGVAVAAAKVNEARHKYNNVLSGWETFPAVQMDVAVAAAQAICAHYSIDDICGHDNFAAYRGKRDPGPLFPMSDFIDKVLGAGGGNSAGSGLMEVWAPNGLNLRQSASSDAPKVARTPNPLPTGTKVRVTQELGEWLLVHVIDANGNDSDMGWCYRQFLKMT